MQVRRTAFVSHMAMRRVRIVARDAATDCGRVEEATQTTIELREPGMGDRPSLLVLVTTDPAIAAAFSFGRPFFIDITPADAAAAPPAEATG